MTLGAYVGPCAHFVPAGEFCQYCHGTGPRRAATSHPVKRIEDGHADTEGEAVDSWAHLNCPACGGSGHIDDTHPLPEQPQEGDAAAQIASLKQRLESAEEYLADMLKAMRNEGVCDDTCISCEAARTFLQEQEKQNG